MYGKVSSDNSVLQVVSSNMFDDLIVKFIAFLLFNTVF